MTAVDYAFAWGVTVGVIAGALITRAYLALRGRKW